MEVAEAGCRQSWAPRLERGAILIAIDERSLTDAVADQLEDVGFSTRIVTNGYEAVRLLAETSPRLVLLGASTPPVGEIELMRRMHASRRIPVILVRGEGRAADRIVGLRRGRMTTWWSPSLLPSWSRGSKPCSGAPRDSDGGAPQWQSAVSGSMRHTSG